MSNIRPLKENVSVSLDSDVIEMIKDFAAYEGRPFSQYINEILREHVGLKPKKDPRIKTEE